jgi:hypothetical protein
MLKKAANPLLLLFLFAMTSGCDGGPANKIEGQWKYDHTMIGSELAGMSKFTEGMPPDTSLTKVTIKGTSNYHSSGTFNHSLEMMSMSLETQGLTVEMSFQGSMSGKWTLQGDTLTEVTSDMQMEPANEFTTTALAQLDPEELNEMFAGQSDSVVSKIEFISKDELEQTDAETGITIALRRAR